MPNISNQIDTDKLTSYEQWQLQRFGNMIKEQGEPENENGLEASEKFRKWSDDQEIFSLTEQSF